MRLTTREKEIVEALQKEPLISQEELALQFGISRSSVAVHISNLMKKGIILGKGYIFSHKSSVVVVGQVGLEIRLQGMPEVTAIDLQHAGFGLDICKDLFQFGVSPKLVTIVGNDELGHDLLEELLQLEVDINNIYRHPHKRTSKWVRSDEGFSASEAFSPEEYQKVIAAREWVVGNCDYLLVEPELREIVAAQIGERQGEKPAMCGHWFFPQEMPPGFKYCNLAVIGVEDFKDYDSYMSKAMEMIATGTMNCIITDGLSNMVAVSSGGASDYPLLPGQVFDSRAQLGTFMAGLVYGLSAHYPLRQAMRIAAGAAHSGSEKSAG